MSSPFDLTRCPRCQRMNPGDPWYCPQCGKETTATPHDGGTPGDSVVSASTMSFSALPGMEDYAPRGRQVLGAATISDCGTYRYRLSRTWQTGPRLVYLMLNPSTADATTDDRTIRRCMFYARREGYVGIDVVNLFAYRATQPAELGRCTDPVGPENDGFIRLMCGPVEKVVVAWGASRFASPARVHAALRRTGHREFWCLGVNADGSPRHPARLPNAQPLTQWPWDWGSAR